MPIIIRCPFLHNDEFREFESMKELAFHLETNHDLAQPYKMAEIIEWYELMEMPYKNE